MAGLEVGVNDPEDVSNRGSVMDPVKPTEDAYEEAYQKFFKADTNLKLVLASVLWFFLGLFVGSWVY